MDKLLVIILLIAASLGLIFVCCAFVIVLHHDLKEIHTIIKYSTNSRIDDSVRTENANRSIIIDIKEDLGWFKSTFEHGMIISLPYEKGKNAVTRRNELEESLKKINDIIDRYFEEEDQ